MKKVFHVAGLISTYMYIDRIVLLDQKSGKWNAMHVRVAWEIYQHQQKIGTGSAGDSKPALGSSRDLLRPPTHLFGNSGSSGVGATSSRAPPPVGSAHDLGRYPGRYDPGPPPPLFGGPGLKFGPGPPPPPHSSASPFTRYAAYAPPPPNAFSVTHPLSLSGLHAAAPHHDPWRTLQRTLPAAAYATPMPPTLPPVLGPPSAPWTIKPDPVMLEREREEREQREKLRREREERERREREEKQRQHQQQQRLEQERREKERRELERRELERERERERLLHQQRLDAAAKMAAIRDRSPIRNGQPESEVRVKEEPRPNAKDDELRYHPYLRHPAYRMLPPPPPLGHYAPPPPSHWPPPPPPGPTDFYHHHLRYNSLLDVMRAEEERAKCAGRTPKT